MLMGVGIDPLQGTVPMSINPDGAATGWYFDSSSVYRCCVRLGDESAGKSCATAKNSQGLTTLFACRSRRPQPPGKEKVMSTTRVLSIRKTTRLGLSCLAIVLSAIPAITQSNNSSYVFLLASDFLCAPGDCSTCPATAKNDQGDSYEMSGAGTFDVQNKSAKAAGTYTYKLTNGNVLETGVWLADELVSFDSYGAASTLSRQGVAFGPAMSRPRRSPMLSGPMPTGGRAVFRIRLLPMHGPSTTAVLQVNCALGDVPRERSVEGIRLTLDRNKSEYSEEAGGRVMFLAMRPEVSTSAEAQQEKTVPETSEQPPN